MIYIIEYDNQVPGEDYAHWTEDGYFLTYVDAKEYLLYNGYVLDDEVASDIFYKHDLKYTGEAFQAEICAKPLLQKNTKIKDISIDETLL
jgi:hypothetical protein